MILGAVAGLISGVVSAMGTIAAGKAQQAAMENQAAQYEIEAAWKRAVSEAQSDEKREEAELYRSRVQAIASSGGFSAMDPSTIDLIFGRGGSDSLLGKGYLQAQQISDAGQHAAFSDINAANVARAQGSWARQGASLQAFGTLASAIGAFGGQMFDLYAGGGFSPPVSQYTGPSLIYG